MWQKPAGLSIALMGVACLPQARMALAAPASVVSKQFQISALPVVARIKVPVGPGWLETGFGSLWVSKSRSKRVLRIDPATNQIVARIPVGSDPELGIGVGLGFVWIADTKDHSITQIDPQTNRVVRTIPVNVGDDPEGSIGVGEGSIWVLTSEGGTDSGTLTRIDAESGEVRTNITVRPKSHAAIVAFNSVWVTSTGSNTVSRIDPTLNTVMAEIPVHSLPRFLIASEDSVWVLSQGDGSLIRVDPSNNRVAAVIEMGVPGPGGDLSVGENYVWVSAERVPLSQIDPQKNRLVRQFVGGRKDDTMRVGFGSAWVLDERHGEIWRIDLEKFGNLPLPP
jgi:virginiamycin B lyase